MKTIKILSVSIFSMAFAISVQAQNILEQHFGGNRDSLIVEATKLIDMDNPTFDASTGAIPMDSLAMAEMGFEQPYTAEHRMFKVRDGKSIFAYKFANESTNTIILIGIGG